MITVTECDGVLRTQLIHTFSTFWQVFTMLHFKIGQLAGRTGWFSSWGGLVIRHNRPLTKASMKFLQNVLQSHKFSRIQLFRINGSSTLNTGFHSISRSACCNLRLLRVSKYFKAQ
jgi:hypothetical protein